MVIGEGNLMLGRRFVVFESPGIVFIPVFMRMVMDMVRCVVACMQGRRCELPPFVF